MLSHLVLSLSRLVASMIVGNIAATAFSYLGSLCPLQSRIYLKALEIYGEALGLLI